jgi:hypothetical protein
MAAMPRVTIQLRPWSGVEWNNGKWTALDDRTAKLLPSLRELVKGNPERVFSRAARVIDSERVSRLASASAHGRPTDLPDLNSFYVVDGDPAALAAHELVESVSVDAPLADPGLRDEACTSTDTDAHERDARGQGVTIATLARAQDLFELAPEAAVDVIPPFLSLADAIDRGAAELGFGDVLLAPHPLASPAARAAARHAVGHGVTVVVSSLDGKAIPGVIAGTPGTAGRAACVQSYATGVGLGRLAPADLATLPGFPDDLPKALDALDQRVAKRPAPRPYAKVTFDKATIIAGGDIGAAEIYFEGWVDDGRGGRRAFRIPHEGHIPDVRNGQTIPLKTVVFESRRPVGDHLTVHLEAWDEDLGRSSLIDPDDLLGVYEKRHTAEDRWGEGTHAEQRVSTRQGAWLLTYTVALELPA